MIMSINAANTKSQNSQENIEFLEDIEDIGNLFEDSIIPEENKIYSTVAIFNNFSPEKPIDDAVIYFWESHTKNPTDRERVKATEDLIYKQFDVTDCEKYEVRTGYLSRFNHMKRRWDEVSGNELDEAIQKGMEDQNEWLERCSPNLPGFIKRDWSECISPENNPCYEACKALIKDKLATNTEFLSAFLKSVDAYADKHGTLKENGQKYILEEIAWIMSLGLLHINRRVYLIHVGNDNPAIKSMFHHFPNLAKAVKWLAPRFVNVTFANVAEFLFYYRSNNYAGCSYASYNPELVTQISPFYKKDSVSKESLSSMLDREHASRELLLSIIGKIPGHVYWLNRNGVYLGCNDSQAIDFGLKSREEVIGKTNRDLLPDIDAENLDRINKSVMDSGKIYEGEELASMQNIHGNYLTRKTPLFDVHGKVIGLLGLSVDITDRKRLEALEIENKLRENRIKDQETFRQFISTMAHDITSPLSALEMLSKSCGNLDEGQKAALASIVNSIKNISNALLQRYKKDQYEDSMRVVQNIPVALALAEVVEQKKHEYMVKKDRIDIHCFMTPSSKFTFVKIDRSSFDRMISNLINNSVEAIDGRSGRIDVQLKSDKSSVTLCIKDNGRGMSKDTANRIVRGIPVETTKEEGHGIGMSQINAVLQRYGGKIAISSEIDVGTEITLTFPRCAAPDWFTDSLTLKKGSTILILDDDTSILEAWKQLLSQKAIDMKCFSDEESLSNFIESMPEQDKKNLFLISDYNISGDKSGLVVIMECGMKDRAMLVTGVINDNEMFGLAQKLGLKVLPKQFMNDLVVKVD